MIDVCSKELKKCGFNVLARQVTNIEYIKTGKCDNKREFALCASIGKDGIKFRTVFKKSFSQDELKMLLEMAAEFSMAACGESTWSIKNN